MVLPRSQEEAEEVKEFYVGMDIRGHIVKRAFGRMAGVPNHADPLINISAGHADYRSAVYCLVLFLGATGSIMTERGHRTIKMQPVRDRTVIWAGMEEDYGCSLIHPLFWTGRLGLFRSPPRRLACWAPKLAD